MKGEQIDLEEVTDEDQESPAVAVMADISLKRKTLHK